MNPVSPAAEPEALIERRGCAGFITLNRPKALNALTLGMVRAIAAALDAWEGDDSVERVVVLGAGERAFCAGGDIRRLYEQGLAGDHDAQLTFWREEYQLNRRIKTYSKPYVALIDGIVMGGGVGVSAYASRRVAGERYRFAMPEVGIGFFPDVGATWLLPRLPRAAGAYLALTGANAQRRGRPRPRPRRRLCRQRVDACACASARGAGSARRYPRSLREPAAVLGPDGRDSVDRDRLRRIGSR